MAHRELGEAVQKYYSEALTAATKRTYRAGQKRYMEFCKQFKLNPIPVSESNLCYFVAFLGEKGLMASSINGYLSAIRQWQISEGHPEPARAQMPRLKQLLKGVKVVRGKEGRATRKKLPITPSILQKIWQLHVKDERAGPDREMFWAACCLAFFGFLRGGELTVPSQQAYDPSYHLNLADILADHQSRPTIIHIRIKASKTYSF